MLQARFVCMDSRQPHSRLLQALNQNPRLLIEFYLAASEIVDDFEDWGPVLQADLSGEYDETTSISRLRKARNAIILSERSLP